MNSRSLRYLVGGALLLAVMSVTPVFGASSDASASPVTCKDGTTSEHGGRGACRGHGGIDKTKSAASGTESSGAAAKSAGKSGAKSDANAGAASAPASGAASASGMVACKDGTTSEHGGRGACRGHGGIDKTKSAGAS